MDDETTEKPHNHNFVLFGGLLCLILLLPIVYLFYKLFVLWRMKKEKIKRMLRENDRIKALHLKAATIRALTKQSVSSTPETRMSTSASSLPPRLHTAPAAVLPGLIETSTTQTKGENRQNGISELDPTKISKAQCVERNLMDIGPLPQDISDLEEEIEERRRKLLKMP
ncbi:unnamed protein product, partial [Mesorhabditis belari]|uniref:Uncharacterized protein n=1 Tax=Mesorhabditis belari TaxID=2138241 RepID=A0AAF3FN41_9BILA